MSRKIKPTPPETIDPLFAAFEEEFLDIDHWPQAWRVESQDLAPGQRMLDIFKVFLVHQLSLGRARKTLRLHRDLSRAPAAALAASPTDIPTRGPLPAALASIVLRLMKETAHA
jgi:hypothetical protein